MTSLTETEPGGPGGPGGPGVPEPNPPSGQTRHEFLINIINTNINIDTTIHFHRVREEILL